MMPEIAAVLFDLDGTLVDSEPLWMTAVGLALEGVGCPYTPAELYELIYGRGWHEIFGDVQRRAPGAFAVYDDFLVCVQGHFTALRATRGLRIPGSVEAFVALAARYPVAIVSGSTRADIAAIVAELGLAPWLRDFLGCEDYPHGKPHPSGFLLAAERLGVAPTACLVIEDSPHGICAAKAAGMICVALCRPGGPVLDTAAADYRVPDLRHLLRDGQLCLEDLS